jgi:hypothetical protein
LGWGFGVGRLCPRPLCHAAAFHVGCHKTPKTCFPAPAESKHKRHQETKVIITVFLTLFRRFQNRRPFRSRHL